MSRHTAISRRTLFQTSAAIAAAGALPAGRASASPRAVPLHIGLASYSMRKQSVDDMLALCKEIDVKYLTVKEMHLPRNSTPEQIQQIKDKIAAAGVAITGGGVINWNKGDEAAIRKDFEYAKAAKFPLIVASPGPDAIDVAEKLMKEFNIPVAIHNHGPEDKHYQTPREVLAAIKNRDKRMGACMDIGHTFRAGVNPVDMVAELGDRLMDLHVKDLKDKMKKESQTEVGRGQLDIVGLFKALQRRRYNGHIGLEYEINTDHPENGIRESIAYMKGVADALVG